MQTTFSDEQLRDPDMARSNEILRSCVHCGFCTATCPTYQLLGDELDSPRGRIYLMKSMLEEGRPADRETVKHIDRCLSCLACMTTCPSGVHYMHLVDHARAHIEQTYRRPLGQRALRSLLAFLLPRPTLFRLSLAGAMVAKPVRRLAPWLLPGKLGAMVDFAPRRLPSPSSSDLPKTHAAVRAPGETGAPRKRVALLTGCAQKVLAPNINEATIRLLTRLGVEVVVSRGSGCCGALTHHMGKSALAHGAAVANVRAWAAERRGDGLDAVVINASGCGTTVKDYGHMLRTDPKWAADAADISAITRDVSEFLLALGIDAWVDRPRLRVAYLSSCSLQHGQQVKAAPKQLLKAAGFEVVEPKEAHLCCGSAGTYNLLQPELANQLKARKVRHLEATRPDVIATANIGCMTQVASSAGVPVVHTVELLDWATGGPQPEAMAGLSVGAA